MAWLVFFIIKNQSEPSPPTLYLWTYPCVESLTKNEAGKFCGQLATKMRCIGQGSRNRTPLLSRGVIYPIFIQGNTLDTLERIHSFFFYYVNSYWSKQRKLKWKAISKQKGWLITKIHPRKQPYTLERMQDFSVHDSIWWEQQGR